MLTINVIGKNCNVKIDGTLYTVVVNEKFDLKKLQNLGLKYYFNLNESKNYFDEAGEHITSEKRASYKATADAYKSRIFKMVLEAIEAKTNEKTKKRIEKKLQEKKLRSEKREYLQKENAKFYIFKQLKDFTVRNGTVYLKGLNFELPQDFLDVISKEYNNNHLNLDEVIKPYINFMYHLADNRYEKVRNKAFGWMKQSGFKITENGYIYCVRWVRKVSEISKLTNFVQAEYVKKKLQKKSPKNYSVWEEVNDDISTYHLIEGKRILENKVDTTNLILNGNLFELYNKEEELRFTDNYTRKMDIRYHKTVELDHKDCDSSDRICSKGLHGYNFNYALECNFGDTLIGVLISPADLVALPYTDGSKFRCCKYYVKDILNESVLEELKLSEMVVNDMDYEELNLDLILEKLEVKTKLFEHDDKLEVIKAKLKELKGSKPDEPEQFFAINRLIKL